METTTKKKSKLASRKLWITIAIILGGVASVISGACTDNTALTIIGGICATLSAVLYEICETVIDTAAVGLEEEEEYIEAEDEDSEAVG